VTELVKAESRLWEEANAVPGGGALDVILLSSKYPAAQLRPLAQGVLRSLTKPASAMDQLTFPPQPQVAMCLYERLSFDVAIHLVTGEMLRVHGRPGELESPDHVFAFLETYLWKAYGTSPTDGKDRPLRRRYSVRDVILTEGGDGVVNQSEDTWQGFRLFVVSPDRAGKHDSGSPPLQCQEGELLSFDDDIFWLAQAQQIKEVGS
jgi:hypothetical protein